ncbi:hypothetical protein C8Q74DRAFT_1215737 [Fomes fomentarius]|nr:hypothetical protein C8Q74DRAFT_1215737 [Fomes fomentarius]
MSKSSPSLPYDLLVAVFRQLDTIDLHNRSKHWHPKYGTSLAECKHELHLRRKTLASAALASKEISDLASKELWAAPSQGLYTVLGLLSAFNADSHSYRLTEPVDPAEWGILVRRAACVRTLWFDREILQYRAIGPAVFESLHIQSEGRVIFPLVQHLAWVGGPEKLVHSLLRMLVGASVASFTILPSGFEPYPVDFQQRIQIVASACPHLVEVHIDRTLKTVERMPLITNIHLREATFGCVPFSSVEHLSALPHLQQLTFIAYPEAEDEDDLGQVSRPGFPSLRRLNVNGVIPSTYAVRFIQLISSAPLVSATVSIITLDREAYTVRPFDLLCSTTPARSLRSLDLHISAEPQIIRQFSGTFSPLLRLQQLELLQLTLFDTALEITDHDVAQMTASWPHITKLSLLPQPWDTAEPVKLTVASADVSEEELRMLEERAAHRSAELTRSGKGQTGGALEWMFLGDMSNRSPSLPDVDRVARALRGIFPDLRGGRVGLDIGQMYQLLDKLEELWEEDTGRSRI